MDMRSNIQAAEDTMMTALGEMPKEANADGIKRFSIKMKSKGVDPDSEGITHTQVLKLSRREDIKRANDDIKWFVPMLVFSSGSGRLGIKFRTDASKKYGASQHEVSVEFLDVRKAIANMADKKPLQTAKDLINGRLKFDCDCGRHRYWYRYIAHTGRWSIGHPETRFPKIRNPRLTGVACKHVVRVMHGIENSRSTMNMIVKYLDKPMFHRQDEAKVQRTIKAHKAEPKKITVKREALIKRKDVAKEATKTAEKATKAQEIMAKAFADLKAEGMTTSQFMALAKQMSKG